jgi:hypothetical protein
MTIGAAGDRGTQARRRRVARLAVAQQQARRAAHRGEGHVEAAHDARVVGAGDAVPGLPALAELSVEPVAPLVPVAYGSTLDVLDPDVEVLAAAALRDEALAAPTRGPGRRGGAAPAR